MEEVTLEFVKRVHCGRAFFYAHNQEAEQFLDLLRSGGRKRRALREEDFPKLEKIGLKYRILQVKEVIE